MVYITLTRATSLSFTSLCNLTTQTYSLPMDGNLQSNHHSFIVLYQKWQLVKALN